MKRAISVFGASVPSEEERGLAFEVGKRLAAEGLVVVCGGLGGVMEAVCRGAKSLGGTTVGILPGRDPDEANPFVDIAIPTGMGEARNVIIARTGRAAVAVGGGLGTLSEIAVALRLGKTVVGLSTWRLDPERAQGAPFIEAHSAQEAVSLALSALSKTQGA